MERKKERYETPDLEELEGNLFLAEAEPSKQEIEGDVDEEELDY